MIDKLSFIISVIILLSFTCFISKYPNDHFYTYYLSLTTVMFISRSVHYYSTGAHYYMIDFCYPANYILMWVVYSNSRHVTLIKTCFLFAHGILAFSIVLFKNSLVLRKLEKLTSLGVHYLPVISTYLIKWFTIPS